MPAPTTASRRRGRALPWLLLVPLLLATTAFSSAPRAASVAEGTPTPATLHYDETSLTLEILSDGQQWQLSLTPKELISDAGDWQSALLDIPRFFDGQVSGKPTGWARIAIEGTDNEVFSGHVFIDDELHELQWRAELETHVLIHMPAGLTLNDMVMPSAPDDPYPSVEPARDDASTEAATRDALIDTGSETASRAIRIGIAVDSAYDAYHEGRGLAHALTLINGVDGLYQEQLGLALMVDGFTLYDDPQQDPLHDFPGDVDQILSRYRDLRLEDDNLPNDLALVHLFSGHPDPNRVIGLGWIDTLCRMDGYDVSLSTPFPYDMLLAAHEIAHNLGAEHDDSAACSADPAASGGNEIMWSEISGTTRPSFSGCSLERIRPAMAAACVMDNIDVAVALSAEAADSTNALQVTIAAYNNDFARQASQLSSLTRFPDGTRLSHPDIGCRIEDSTLYCKHSALPPGGQSTLTVTAEFLNHGATDPLVFSEILPDGFADTRRQDNTTTLRLDDAGLGLDSVTFADAGDGAPDSEPAAANPDAGADSITADAADSSDEIASGGSAGVGGLGPAGLLGMALLLSGVGVQRRRSGGQHLCQYLRSTA